MTDLDHLDDEALSAVLDGEGTEVEAAHAAACPTCANRVHGLHTAAQLIGQPVAIDPDQRDAAIRIALETPLAISLGAHRRRLQGRHLAFASAAAAAIIAIVAIPLATQDSEPTQSAATDQAATTTTLFGAQADRRTAAPNAAAEGGMESLAAPAGPDLGELAGTDLRARLADVPRSSDGPPAPCEDRARAEGPGKAERTLSATATWNGEEAVVIVLRADGTEHAYVLTRTACEIVEAVTL